MSWETQGMALLAASLVRPIGLAATAWLMLHVFRVRHPASRHAVWTAVLIGMLLLPVVSVVTPHWKLPVLRARQAAAVPAQAPGLEAASEGFGLGVQRAAASHPTFAVQLPPVETLVWWCYLAGLLAIAAYRVAGWALVRRLLLRSRSVRNGRVRESDDVLAPVAVGVLRPAVVLPAGWREWSASTKRAVLAHEFAHIRRRDALVAAIARFAQWVLWFHPLAWWVRRQISECAELACDAAALARVGDPAGYSRILLGFADAVNRAGYRAALPGLEMAGSSGMGRRIDQVFELSDGRMRKLARPGVLLALAGVPVMCLAATVGLSESSVRLPHRAAGPVSLREVVQLAQAAPGERAAAPRATLAGPYRKWLNEDVAYIITDAERSTYKQLVSDNEHEKFIEQFWLRRDPTPGTVSNEFKEEHYRRIAYANQHYAGNIPGWKTDRGRVYIQYGPPNEIDRNLAVGRSGERITTYPFEIWHYHLFQGVGNMSIEFVDRERSGEYRLSLDPNEKNATPGAK